MSDIESLRQTVAAIIPFNRALDISITSVSPDRVELMQPEAPERLNAVGDDRLFSRMRLNVCILNRKNPVWFLSSAE
jgi:hypothetical protein